MSNNGYMLMLDTMAHIGLAASAKRDGDFIDYVTALDCVEADLISIGELLEHQGAKVDWRSNPALTHLPADILYLSHRLSKLDTEIEMLDKCPHVEVGTFIQCVRTLKKETF